MILIDNMLPLKSASDMFYKKKRNVFFFITFFMHSVILTLIFYEIIIQIENVFGASKTLKV